MALIKCKECGNMISDKAVRCPKCGFPTKEVVSQQNHDATNIAPVYYDEEEEGNSHKWLYAIIAILLAAIAGGGYWWYSQSEGNQEIREFVEKFAVAVETGDSVTIQTIYPDAKYADSLYIPDSEPLISKVDESNSFKVEWNKNIWIELSPQVNEKWIVRNSQGVFVWPEDAMVLAKKTGQWKAGLTDKELSTRMSDKGFIEDVMDEFCKIFKKKVIQKGSLRVLKEAKFDTDDWTLGITIANSNDIQISGNDYKVSMQIWDQYLFNNTGNEKDAFVSISVQGKDVAPNGETILSYSLKGHQLVKDSSVKIQWMINNQQIFNKYFVAKGDEYDKYIIAKKQ